MREVIANEFRKYFIKAGFIGNVVYFEMHSKSTKIDVTDSEGRTETYYGTAVLRTLRYLADEKIYLNNFHDEIEQYMLRW